MNPFDLTSPYATLAWFLAGILLFFLLESLIPFRLQTLSRVQRWRINFSVNFSNVLLVDLFFASLLKISLMSVDNPFELLGLWPLNSIGRIAVTVLVLDLSMYIWHRLNHRIPFLWRFHKVHHTDLNVDVSTASRFHFGEVIGSTVITYTLMLMLGASLVEVRLFQVVLFLMAQFGHSNLKLEENFEAFLWLFLVPPSMHRIHHSNLKLEMDSNYATIFSFWDRMFGTFQKNVKQEGIVFGLKEYKNPQELMLLELLVLPFRGLIKG